MRFFCFVSLLLAAPAQVGAMSHAECIERLAQAYELQANLRDEVNKMLSAGASVEVTQAAKAAYQGMSGYISTVSDYCESRR